MPAQRLDTREDRERAIAERRRALGAAANDVVPNPGPQTAVLACAADEILYGGAAGGGKSMALLLAALRHIHRPTYRAILLRRQGPQLKRTLIAKSKELYPRLFPRGQVRWRASDRLWIFPSGATIELAAADKEQDIERYLGSEASFLGWDELTTFTRYQYTYMLSRLRTTDPLIPLRVLSTSNPGSVGHDWVLSRWAPFLYPPGHSEYDGPRAAPGEVLSFLPIGDSDEERVVPLGTPGALSRTFFPAKVADTPQLGPEYEAKNLSGLDRLTRKRLKDGDWMARAIAGEFFERGWFEIVDAAPRDVAVRVRYWDLAATPEKKATPTSAWTAGILLSISWEGVMFVEHIARGHWSPGDVESTIRTTREADEIEDEGTETIIERDPAQAGKFQAAYYMREMGIRAIPPHGDKLVRAQKASAQAEAGNVKIVRGFDGGRWIEPFLREGESFPESTKDQIDALSGAVRYALLKWHKLKGSRGRER